MVQYTSPQQNLQGVAQGLVAQNRQGTVATADEATNAATAASAGSATVALSLSCSFGTGAPVTTPARDGLFYFDTTLATYAGYVSHGGAWNPF